MPLVEVQRDGVRLLVDPEAAARGVLVVFGDRGGGVSAPPYDTLNLAARVGDDPQAVAVNRRRFAAAAGFEPGALALARQVHGDALLEVRPGDSGVIGEADVLAARAAGTVPGVLTADCAAVVVAGRGGVAVAHAGWRGLVAGSVRRAVEAVAPAWAAWVGPAIRACCYEVGPEVVEAFSERGLPVAGPRRVDIALAAAAAARAAGVEGVAVAGACTSCDARYFSYRRDGTTGRQAAVAALVEPS